jgi:hypothetical protein
MLARILGALVITLTLDDFPSTLPGVLDRKIKMVVEESIHYSLSPEARPAWYAAFPDGVGSVRLGSHHRAFFVYAHFCIFLACSRIDLRYRSMYHEVFALQAKETGY